jgi:hypothetical protein
MFLRQDRQIDEVTGKLKTVNIKRLDSKIKQNQGLKTEQPEQQEPSHPLLFRC